MARMVEWSSHDGGRRKFRTESKALRWAKLPGGAWYVTAWDRLLHLDKLDAWGRPAAEQQPRFVLNDEWRCQGVQAAANLLCDIAGALHYRVGGSPLRSHRSP